MIIDLKETLKDLDGNDIATSPNNDEKYTIGKALARILIQTENKAFDPFKLYELAKMAHEGKELEVLDSDKDTFKAIISTDKQHSNLITGQLLSKFI